MTRSASIVGVPVGARCIRSRCTASTWPSPTLDPVSTGRAGWQDFSAYNAFRDRHGGKPLFNQSPSLTPSQADAAFGPEIRTFQRYRERYDPDDRFYPEFFRHLFSAAVSGPDGGT